MQQVEIRIALSGLRVAQRFTAAIIGALQCSASR
jgi:hypothetical protein